MLGVQCFPIQLFRMALAWLLVKLRNHCVLEFHIMKSVITTQGALCSKYKKNQPSENSNAIMVHTLLKLVICVEEKLSRCLSSMEDRECVKGSLWKAMEVKSCN